ncbi:dTMP kinase [Candidatus Poribacteria bacterium]|nr:dTMP kinase [Candidatus Poribacteria bacterium]
MRGLFITFEGTEGCGKTTQLKMLSEYLEKKKIKHIVTKEPGGTKISDKIREIVMNPEFKMMTPITELCLYTASRAQHIEEQIIPTINKGEIVLCDRFSDSMIAYQCFGRSISRKLVDTFNRLATHGFKPDLTFMLEIPFEIGLERAKKTKKQFSSSGKGDRLEQEKLDFHMRVLRGYKKIAMRNPKRVKVIDGTGSKDKVFKDIRLIVDEKFEEMKTMVDNYAVL